MHGDFIMSDNLKFSLIMATLGRDKEIAAFCKSLAAQTYKNYELIIVDQNDDDRLIPIVEEFKTQFQINRICSSQKGAAFNRNYGVLFANNEIITFPDDDCIYKSTTLEEMNRFINANCDYDFYFCNLEYINSKKIRYKSAIEKVTFFNAPERGIEFTFFYKKKSAISLFDEAFGVGSKWGSNEIVDLVWNNLSKGKKGIYNGQFSILHPDKSNIINLNRTYSYALGFGASYKKAISVYKVKLLFFQFLKAVLRNIIAIIIVPQSKKHMYIQSLKGKLKGFKEYRSEKK